MRGFPHSIVVPGDGAAAPPWVKGLSTALAHEADNPGPGSEVVMARLSDALVTRALRHHLETSVDPGWLAGLRDPAVAAALAAVHADPAAAWDLPALAAEAGQSRSAFAARFSEVVGQTPMNYVFEYRMRRAAHLLSAGGGATIASVASAVGYGSEAAFAAAFVRYAGRPPGAYRRSSALLGAPEAAVTLHRLPNWAAHFAEPPCNGRGSRVPGRTCPGAPRRRETEGARMSVGTDTETKNKIIAEYATTEGDTGSPEVQIALLSHRISHLTEHLKTAQARPPQPARPAAAGRPAPSVAQLPEQDRHRALPLDHRASRPAPLNSRRTRWCGSSATFHN